MEATLEASKMVLINGKHLMRPLLLLLISISENRKRFKDS